MKPDEISGAEGVMWEALLANLDENDAEHAKQRVRQSIEEDRNRALNGHEEPEPSGS